VTSAVTTAMRVIGGVHNDTANGRADALAAFAASGAYLNVLMSDVTDDTDSGCSAEAEAANLTAWHANECVIAFFSHQLSLGARCAHHLCATAWVDFDSIDLRTDWDVLKRQTIAGFDRAVSTATNNLALFHSGVG
jgi:hypothetical protein